MQNKSFEVAIDPARNDSFVTVSEAYLNSTLVPLYRGKPPSVVPLRISDGHGADKYVGCLVQSPHRQAKFKLLLSTDLAQDLGVTEGQLVECVPLQNIPHATKVLVAPLTVDDSEVVEQNALRIENQLLRQIQVVFPGMVITVFIFSGVRAKVKVQSIECGDGNEIKHGGVNMTEGTHFVVATRPRQQGATAADGSEVPRWAFLRTVPPARAKGDGSSEQAPAAASVLAVHPKTAALYHWKADVSLQALDVRLLPTMAEPKITPAFLRANNIRVTIALDETIAEGTGTLGTVTQPTNLLLYPSAVERAEADGHEVTSPSTDADHEPHPAIPFHLLEAVHEGVPHELLDHLRFIFNQPCGEEEMVCGNVLLCGGKGYGKSTIVSSVLKELSGVHAVTLECTSARTFLAALHRALAECILCAPSVLVLDNFDTIAPDQKEGNQQAISAATGAILEATLTTFANTFSIASRNSVVVVATCTSRDAVNESLRGATCFQKMLAVNALTRATRCALLAQYFPSVTAEEVDKMAALMDNYTPFDVRQIATRIEAPGSKTESLLDRAERCVAAFTPLAHTGIKFLKGEKLSWDTIGGLREAKKALYDTLVLPMRHPQLFARLPLKTRSGILLYGPSGCGKTFAIESLVNAENLNCIVVNGPEVFGKYIGQSEQKIRDVFERAQAAAPCVVFFDEFDSVAPQRGVDNSGVTDRVVNQLLCYLDGVEGRKDVYVVAASSRPDLIDAALLRPGRLDKAVVCPIPSAEDRVAILRSLFAKIATEFSPSELEAMAAKTENWTPADLSAMVSSASTLVSQRIIEGVTAGGINGGSEDEDHFVITNVGSGVSREKVADAMRVLEKKETGSSSGSARIAAAEEKMSMDDVQKAMDMTRPSLSAKDIAKQQRIEKLFSRGESLPTPNPGVKITYS